MRVFASDLSVADAKLFATVARNLYVAIFDCAFCAGLAIRAFVFLLCRCFYRAWLLAALRSVPAALVAPYSFGTHAISFAASAPVPLLYVSLPSQGLLRLRVFTLSDVFVAMLGWNCVMLGFGSFSMPITVL